MKYTIRLRYFALAFLFGLFLTHAQDTLVKDSIIKVPIKQDVYYPVTLKGDTIFNVANNEEKANLITSRLQDIPKKYTGVLDSIYALHLDRYVEVLYNERILFIVTENDSKDHSEQTLTQLANARVTKLKEILEKPEDESLTTTLFDTGYFLASLVGLLILLKIIQVSFRKIDVRLSKIERTILKKNKYIIKYIVPKETKNIFVFLSKIIRYILIGVLLFVYTPFMFSFFKWAKVIVYKFYGYLLKPVKYVVFSFIDYIPSLIFIVVILYVVRFISRVISDVSLDLETGDLKINKFHKDWARPTGKLITILLYAIALVVVFPYLPGSGSSAFQGVSIFIGAIISFGSTSAIANIIAGVVITYMRPFKVDDRVKIGEITGDIIKKTILVTHVRTPKNEDVTIPNANVLISNIVNYSKNNKNIVILHTTVTLGYDLPWQTAEELLLKAASITDIVEEEPHPFVLKTSLDDYYVSYELNFHIVDAKKMPLAYSEVHKHILDVFNEAGVEILSPAFVSARDGSLSTVPSQLSPDDKPPLNKLVDHLTGRNQKNIVNKNKED